MRFALVTPSYGPDYDRCELLCRSVDSYLTGRVRHVLIVDGRDYDRFKGLAGRGREVRTVESMLPWWIRRMPGARRWWLSLKTPPIRNWALQQLVKLSAAEHVEADAYVFADSDVVFCRPFDTSELLRDGRLRLARVEGGARLPTHFRWHRTASRLLGLPATDYFGSTYIGNLITWRRDHLRDLYDHLAGVGGLPWLEAVAWRWHISEYILYGVFVEHVLKNAGRHYFDDSPLCHVSWDYPMETEDDVERFFGDLQDRHVAVMVHSKQALPVTRYARLLPAAV